MSIASYQYCTITIVNYYCKPYGTSHGDYKCLKYVVFHKIVPSSSADFIAFYTVFEVNEDYVFVQCLTTRQFLVQLTPFCYKLKKTEHKKFSEREGQTC
jgi:hypothetical protein